MFAWILSDEPFCLASQFLVLRTAKVCHWQKWTIVLIFMIIVMLRMWQNMPMYKLDDEATSSSYIYRNVYLLFFSLLDEKM